MRNENKGKVTSILEVLDETGTLVTARRVKREIENIPRTESIDAKDYGQLLSFISRMGLVERGETRKGKWGILPEGREWLDNEIDVRKL